MIAKHVAMRTIQKSDFAGLVKYIADPQDKHERVDYVSVTNCHTDDPAMAILEVTHTQSRNTRSSADKTYHLIVSFRAGEHPDSETLRAIEESICVGLGYGEHQRVSALHSDTDNLHLHIAINKIHPVRFTIHTPYNDHKALGALCERLEREYGLQVDNHQAQKTGAENRAGDMERHAGVESLLGWIKRECLTELKAAQSWTEFQKVLTDNGLKLMLRGNGFVMTDGNGTMVKGSTVAREFSKGQLEARFGPFEPVAMPTENALGKQYVPRPLRVRVDTTELYARYQAEQQARSANRSQSWVQVKDRRYRLMETARRTARLKRAVIKLMGGSASTKRMLYAMTSKALTANLDRIARQYRDERTTVYSQNQRQVWADWLRSQAAQGDRVALETLRARTAAQSLSGNTVSASGALTSSGATPVIQDSITKKGTAIYTASRAVIRDDGKRLKVSKGLTHQAAYTALRMAMDRYGSHLSISGTEEFKTQIVKVAALAQLAVTFDDADLERRRQALMNHPQETTTHDTAHDRGRGTRGGSSATGPASPRPDGRSGARRDNFGGLRDSTAKPNVSRVGRKPPPERQNRLRDMSALGVVRLTEGSEVLLPGDVLGHVEHPRAQRNDPLRRPDDRTGLTEAAWRAADMYIEERNRTRLYVVDIPQHSRYNNNFGESLTYGGLRTIEGQSLALLRKDDQVFVLPVDKDTAMQLRRKLVGDAVSIVNGTVQQPKGRIR